MPNPPGYDPPPPLTLWQAWAKLTFAIRGYIDTWDEKKLKEALRQQGELRDDEEDTKGSAEMKGVLDDLSKYKTY